MGPTGASLCWKRFNPHILPLPQRRFIKDSQPRTRQLLRQSPAHWVTINTEANIRFKDGLPGHSTSEPVP